MEITYWSSVSKEKDKNVNAMSMSNIYNAIKAYVDIIIGHNAEQGDEYSQSSTFIVAAQIVDDLASCSNE